MRIHSLALLALATLYSGCATLTVAPVAMHSASPQAGAAAVLPAAAPAPTTGAIFNAGGYRPLFEDTRARHVGDVLTIQIEETLSASQQSTTKLDRSGTLSAGVTALPYASKSFLGRLNASANSALAGSADGTTGSSNSFTGVIAVRVQQVLPNGNLLVAGDKEIGVNQNVDALRFSGIVDPATIRAGNVVSSMQVAEARMEQRGRGDVGRLQGLGWLARFFLSVAPV
ncbi:flagellar basal body L-ring protein FlgH [Ramlibacter sp.]|uniref:flagellar basal body L-ring protein FlgH n=1 Tax=Ramlibacter sp. TaxID=1917967 RepID=UPI003D0AFB22